MTTDTERLIEPELHLTNDRLRDIARRNQPTCFVVLRAYSLADLLVSDGYSSVSLLVVRITPLAAERLLETRSMLTRYAPGHVDRAVIDLGSAIRCTDSDLTPVATFTLETHVGISEITFCAEITSEGAEIERDYLRSNNTLEDALGIEPVAPAIYASPDAREYLDIDYALKDSNDIARLTAKLTATFGTPPGTKAA